jgi:hypothetical protein
MACLCRYLEWFTAGQLRKLPLPAGWPMSPRWLDWLSERLKCKYALNPKHHFYKWIITALISCAQWANGLPNVQTAPQCYTLRAAGQQLRGSAKTVAVITVPDG